MTNLLKELCKIIADECNIKKVIINGIEVYEEPMMADKYKDKQKQFDEIYKDTINPPRHSEDA